MPLTIPGCLDLTLSVDDCRLSMRGFRLVQRCSQSGAPSIRSLRVWASGSKTGRALRPAQDRAFDRNSSFDIRHSLFALRPMTYDLVSRPSICRWRTRGEQSAIGPSTRSGQATGYWLPATAGVGPRSGPKTGSSLNHSHRAKAGDFAGQAGGGYACDHVVDLLVGGRLLLGQARRLRRINANPPRPRKAIVAGWVNPQAGVDFCF